MDGGIHRLYLHVYNWPYNYKLTLTGITTKPVRAFALRDKLQTPFSVVHNQMFTEVNVPRVQPDPLVSVVVLEYDQIPEINDGLVAKTVDGGYSLKHTNVAAEEGERMLKNYDRGGTVPPHIIIQKSYRSSWRIFVDQPGEMIVDVSYSFQGEKSMGRILVKAADVDLKHKVTPTDLTVGEPNRDWHIDNFASSRMGTINFPKAGIYEISMEVVAGKEEPVKFHWLWLEGN